MLTVSGRRKNRVMVNRTPIPMRNHVTPYLVESGDRWTHSSTVSSTPMTRYLDYDIDYVAGTIYFNHPVQSRDESANPVYIVAEYEVAGNGAEHTTAGARASFKALDGRLEGGPGRPDFFRGGVTVTSMASLRSMSAMVRATRHVRAASSISPSFSAALRVAVAESVRAPIAPCSMGRVFCRARTRSTVARMVADGTLGQGPAAGSTAGR